MPGLFTLALLPDALGLQTVGHFLGNIALIMLGQHAVGNKDAVRPESTLGDDALLLAEKVGQDAGIGDLDRFMRVRHRKGDRCALPALDRAFFDQSSQPDALAGLDTCRGEIGRHVEVGGLLAKRVESQAGGGAQESQPPDDHRQSFLLARHVQFYSVAVRPSEAAKAVNFLASSLPAPKTA